MGLYVLKYPYRVVLRPLAGRLSFVHPDVVSYSATAVTLATALCFYHAAERPSLLLWAIVLTLLRMTLNTLDGIMAIARGHLSLKGEIVNALPDRYSDVLYVVAIALSPLCSPVLGVLGLASMLLVSYTGMLGKALGVEWQHHGPLGKVERLIIVMAFALYQYVALVSDTPTVGVFGLRPTPLEWAMVVYLMLGQVTVVNRLRGMLAQVTRLEWERGAAERGPGPRALVVFDSFTGNTERVARAIADALGAEARHTDQVTECDAYDLLVVGSLDIRGKPTAKIRRFLEGPGRGKPFAAFITYGMPVWGPISTGLCYREMARCAGRPAVARFSCAGRHPKYGTYKGRPSAGDLERAYLFGVKLARTMGDRT